MPFFNIVVIEDDAAIREVVVQILLSDGFGVMAFANGKEAIDGLRDCKEPCLIFLDLMMPVMSGPEFLEERKNSGDQIRQIPVVVVSAVAEEMKHRHEVKGTLKKPIDIDALLETAHKFCDGCQVSKAA